MLRARLRRSVAVSSGSSSDCVNNPAPSTNFPPVNISIKATGSPERVVAERVLKTVMDKNRSSNVEQAGSAVVACPIKSNFM